MKINELTARKILASKGDWTVEVTLVLEDGSYGIASVPAGVSTGKAEAKTIPAEEAVKLINETLAKELIGRDFADLKSFDGWLIQKDGTVDKSKLGGNTTLALSIAFTKAAAMFKEQTPVYLYLNETYRSVILSAANLPAGKAGNLDSSPGVQNDVFKIPEPLVLVFEGGMHARGLLTIQEFMVKCQTVEDGLTAYKRVAEAMKSRNFPDTVGLEGAFSPPGFSNDDALSLLSSLFGPGNIGLDVADSHLLGTPLNYEEIITKYAPFSLEDVYDEESWDNWEVFNKTNASKVLVVADDLVVTNKIRLQKLIEKKAAGAVVVKPNQIGTVSETLEFVTLAKKAGLKIIVSHRGEETNDDFVADLAVAVGADFVKFGGFARGERLAKYNRLLEISSDLSS